MISVPVSADMTENLRDFYVEENKETFNTESGERETKIIIRESQKRSAVSMDVDGYFQTVKEAGVFIREGLTSRTLEKVSEKGHGVTVGIAVDAVNAYDWLPDAAVNDAVADLWNVITEHTGTPTGGDYILRNAMYYNSSYYMDDSTGYYIFNLEIIYEYSHEEADELDLAVVELLRELDIADKSDYEKVRAIYDWICLNITYDGTFTYHDAYSALCRRTTVCQGYASLFYRLCLEAGVDCRYSGGYAFAGGEYEGHGWNVVKVDNKWYYVDTTWGAGDEPDYYYLLKGRDGLGDHLIVPSRWKAEIGDYCTVTEEDYPIPEKEIYLEYDITPTIKCSHTRSGVVYINGTGSLPTESISTAGKEVIIGEGITSLEPYSIFGACSIKLPNSLVEIKEGGIANFTGNSIYLPDNLKIMSGGIEGRGLNNIMLSPNNPYYTEIDGIIFSADGKKLVLYGRVLSDTTDNSLDSASYLYERYNVPEGVEIIDVNAFSGCVTLKEVNLSDTVYRIESRAFYGCQNAQVNLTDYITYIGQGAFNGCNGLRHVYIGANLSQMNEDVFGSCNLEKIEISPENSMFTVVDNVLFNKDMTQLIKYPNLREGTEYIIPNEVQEIESYAFEGFYSTMVDGAKLRRIVLPDSVTVIKEGAFYCQTRLEDYNLPSNLKYIGDGAFASIGFDTEHKYHEIEIPDSVEYIGNNAFRQNQFLKITIGKSVNHIGSGAFECNNLPKDMEYTPKVYFRGLPPKEMIGHNQYITFGYNDAFSAFNEERIYADILYPKEYEEEWAPNGEIIWSPTPELSYDRYPMGSYYTEGDCYWEGKVTFPTCTEKGYVTYICNICGNSFIENMVEPTDHIWGDWYTLVYPSCSVAREDRRDCKSCEEYETKVFQVEHSNLNVSSFDITCTEPGYTIYFCKDCGYYEEVIFADPYGHVTGDEGIIAGKEATCTETGLTEGYSCIRCNEIMVEQTVIDPLGHKEIIDEALEATCTETGLTEGKHCSVCNEILVEQKTVPTKDHVEVIDNEVPPTCMGIGWTEGKHCGVCGLVTVVQKEITALGHNGEVVPGREPTCMETGLTEGSFCFRCNETLVEQELIPMTDHLWGEWITIVFPNCNSKGEERRSCQWCGIEEMKEMEKIETSHTNLYELRVDATCDKSGYNIYRCDDCGYYEEIIFASPLGHNEDVVPGREPTCTETGLTEGKYCVRCNETLVKQELIPLTDHFWGDWYTFVFPDCINKGEKRRSCHWCETHEIEEISPLGHDEEIIPGYEPTCTETGLTEGMCCSVCNEILVTQETIPVKEHSWDGWFVMNEPTVTEKGEKQRKCAECGITEIEDIPELPPTTEEEPVTPPVVEEGSVEVSKEEIEDALAGATEDEVVIVIQETDVPVQNVQLPVESLGSVAEAEKSLTVETNTATVTLNPEALVSVVEQAGTNATIELNVEEVEKDTLNESQQNALENETKEVAAVISAEILCNGETISDFKGGIVTVQIPFTPAEGMTGEDYVVAYIADDGTIEYLTTTYVDGCLVVDLEHFSEYVILGEAKQNVLIGDVDGNGRVNSRDAVAILRHIIMLANDKFDAVAADMNGNSRVDSRDAVQILRKLIGLE